MRIAPAEKCYCGCSLVQGVHSLAMYAMFNGIFSFLALLVGPHDSSLHLALKFHNACHALGFFFGARGFVGLQMKNAARLHVLALYFAYAWMVNILFQIFRMPYLCAELEKQEPKRKEADNAERCHEIIVITWGVLFLQGFMYAYFSFIVWSLAKKFQTSGAHGLLGPYPSSGTVPYAAESVDVFYPVPVRYERPEHQDQPLRPPQPKSAPPFSGQPYKI
eukprot:GEMP01038863.1.p1 GENE.GEMP01038863.1~~GEMP01038863.1.p1  ORF type:complete len:230 (+),score=19.64 GEMP01038863.1:32-691(+)